MLPDVPKVGNNSCTLDPALNYKPETLGAHPLESFSRMLRDHWSVARLALAVATGALDMVQGLRLGVSYEHPQKECTISFIRKLAKPLCYITT